MDRTNGNRFSVYTSEEKTVLGLLDEIGTQINNNADNLENKTDLYGDHKGSWQGLDRPTMSEEGIRATVEDIIDNKIPTIETSVEDIINNKIPLIETSLDNIMSDYSILPQGNLPAKQGISENHFKLAIKNSETTYNIVQATDLGYLNYYFHSNVGDSTNTSVKENFELLRLKSVEKCNDCILWYEPSPTLGEITKSVSSNGVKNSVEDLLINSNSNITKAKSNNIGLSLYDLAGNSEVEFTFSISTSSKSNILYLSNTNRSDNVEIYINNSLITTINSQKGYSNGFYVKEDFIVPSSNFDSGTYTIKLKNNSSKKFSFVCFNFTKLKDYKGEYINSYKVFETGKYFINADGASDYAIRDLDLGKWCGSFHGGEILLQNKISWNKSQRYFGYDLYEKEYDRNNIDVGFTLIKNLKITQFTNLNDKGKMLSIFDFNNDGTMNMSFGLSDCTIRTNSFYTALTCTSPKFKYIYYPKILELTDNENNFIDDRIGYVEQYDSVNKMKIGIRYNIFNSKYNTLGTYIYSNPAKYSKFYYGVASEYNKGVVIPNLNFSKSLDFYNLEL